MSLTEEDLEHFSANAAYDGDHRAHILIAEVRDLKAKLAAPEHIVAKLNLAALAAEKRAKEAEEVAGAACRSLAETEEELEAAEKRLADAENDAAKIAKWTKWLLEQKESSALMSQNWGDPWAIKTMAEEVLAKYPHASTS